MRPTPAFVLAVIALLCSGCSQRFAVTLNNQTLYDPRPSAGTQQFADPGLQGCVNFALQQPNMTLETLKVLACPGWEIEVLDGIATLTDLQFLDLSDNRISSLAPLQPLRNLSSISILNNRVTDIAPLLSMLTMTSATLSGNDNIQCSQLEALGAKLGQNLRRPAQCRD
jgi:Leucine-rich repeat (LRR) protein